jgi:hypothetical protein
MTTQPCEYDAGGRMRIPLFKALVTGTLAIAIPALAQQQPQPQQPIRRPDGGTSGSMESIFIAPKPGAPFSFTLHTEWMRPLGNGGAFTLTNERHIVRDGRGRIYQERWALVPKGGQAKSVMTTIQITDPEQHTWYNCITFTKVCDLYHYSLSSTDVFAPFTAPTSSSPKGTSSHEHQDLGVSTYQGENTHGYREITTIAPGEMGNDQPMVSTREFWYAPRLAVNLLSTVDDPFSGKQVFTVKDLSISEPEPSYFQVPVDYKVVDRRAEEN